MASAALDGERMGMKCVLSDWELDEMVMLRRRGWSARKLAAWYGVCERTIQRILKKMEQERAGAVVPSR